MKIVKWAAVIVTALMALMNLGAVWSPAGMTTPMVVLAAILGLAGVAAAFGLGFATTWGRLAVVTVGVANAIVAAIALPHGTEGAAIGLIVAALGAVLGWFSPRTSAEPVTA